MNIPNVGFQFTEIMAGNYHRSGEEHPFRFHATARAANVWQFMNDKTATLEGTIDAEGLASGKPIRGSVTIDPFGQRIIRYEFEFDGDDGDTYKFAGQKDITPTHPVDSLSSLHGQVSGPRGHTFGVHLQFQTRDLVSFLASFRPVLSQAEASPQ